MVRRALAVLALTTVAVLVGAGTAGAQSDGTYGPALSGPCEGQATLSNGTVINPRVSGGVYTIPLSGSANWSGRIDVPEQERPISGEVRLELPAPIPDLTWTWDGEATKVSDSGTETWDIPSVVPRGIELRVEGFHLDSGQRCEGFAVVQLEGGFFDSPVGPVAVFGTIISGLGMAVAATVKPR